MANATTYEDNLAAATGYLARFANAPLPHLIGGEAMLSVSGETFANQSPIDGRHLGDVSSGDAADIDAAAKAAVRGFGVWSAMSGAERKVILHKVADLIEERHTRSRSPNASILVRRCASWVTPHYEALRTSASLRTRLQPPMMASHCQLLTM